MSLIEALANVGKLDFFPNPGMEWSTCGCRRHHKGHIDLVAGGKPDGREKARMLRNVALDLLSEREARR